MKIVSTTYELTQGTWIYRFVEDSTGVIIKRVPSDNINWSHGVISQLLDISGVFKQTISANIKKVESLEDALVLVKCLPI